MSNTITITSGNLVNDPEYKEFGSRHVVNFRLADNYYTKEGSKANFYNVEFWGEGNSRAGTLSKNCKKGSRISLFGSLKSELYTDKQGQEKLSLKIEAFGFDFVDSGNQQSDKKMPWE